MTCPKCNFTMVQRTNAFTGEKFMGCSRWPHCRKTVSLCKGAYDDFSAVGLEFENPYDMSSWYDELREY